MATLDGKTVIPGFPKWDLDWQTMLPAVVTNTTFELGAKGIMFSSDAGESEWSTEFPDIPYKDTTEAAQFQAYVADLSVDSLIGSWLEVGSIAGQIQGDDVPGTNQTITASELDIALSGFSKKYGADTIVDLKLACTKLHDFTSSAANQDVTVLGTANLQFWPRFNSTTELAVEIDLVDIKFTGGIAISGYNATADISTFLVDKVVVVSSTIGNISAFKLKLEMNTISRVLVPSLNKFLKKYVVPIPKNILGVFQLSDIFLKYNDGFIYAGATPTFLPPTGPVNSFLVGF